MCGRVTPRSCLISLTCSAGEVPTRSRCALIMLSAIAWCPGDDPAIGRMTAVSIGRCNCSLHRKLLWSALTSNLVPILPAEMESLQSLLISGIQVCNRRRGGLLSELSTMRLDLQRWPVQILRASPLRAVEPRHENLKLRCLRQSCGISIIRVSIGLFFQSQADKRLIDSQLASGSGN